MADVFSTFCVTTRFGQLGRKDNLDLGAASIEREQGEQCQQGAGSRSPPPQRFILQVD